MENEENPIKSIVFKRLDNLEWGRESPDLIPNLPSNLTIEIKNESENEMDNYLVAGEGNSNETVLDLAEFHEVIESILELLNDVFDDETIRIIEEADQKDLSNDENCSGMLSELQSVHEDSGLSISLTDELIKLIDS